MVLSPVDTVLFFNALLNDPRSSKRFEPDEFIESVRRKVSSLEIKRWNPVVRNFSYNATGRSEMITFAFHKSV